jgi:Uma2 family endonuclease
MTSPNDRGTKAEPYRRYGLPHHWIVDPDGETVEAYGLVGGPHALSIRASAT